jgi:hypothetical protein
MRACIVLRSTLAVVIALLLGSPAHAGDEALEAALQRYEDCHWAQAFDGLSRLADAGDPRSARIAALMSRHGPRLYGQSFATEPARLAQWQVLAARAHVPVHLAGAR